MSAGLVVLLGSHKENRYSELIWVNQFCATLFTQCRYNLLTSSVFNGVDAASVNVIAFVCASLKCASIHQRVQSDS